MKYCRRLFYQRQPGINQREYSLCDPTWIQIDIVCRVLVRLEANWAAACNGLFNHKLAVNILHAARLADGRMTADIEYCILLPIWGTLDDCYYGDMCRKRTMISVFGGGSSTCSRQSLIQSAALQCGIIVYIRNFVKW